ncbi:hypothetical protein EJ419_06340 [Alloscardovia theropitheci]|uniref:XRE family transcriptional regulator n=1 Tax=Alloscardovia theropitheci TaxID=2496842 RepID=A0A4R0QR82_9BIFI|nr:hypothetical protein [Alloscardovia theropitheci]TCD53868.1 hypothetical protein EJ419_06340 [Alloscardovia theropitheci]
MASELDKTISKNVRIYLAARDCTQRKLADFMGDHPMVTSKRMRNQMTWRAEDIEKAAEFFGIEPSVLVTAHDL